MKEEWKEYYLFLFSLQESGVCNMFGAVPYLCEAFSELTKQQARDILANWMENYDEIREKYYN